MGGCIAIAETPLVGSRTGRGIGESHRSALATAAANGEGRRGLWLYHDVLRHGIPAAGRIGQYKCAGVVTGRTEHYRWILRSTAASVAEGPVPG